MPLRSPIAAFLACSCLLLAATTQAADGGSETEGAAYHAAGTAFLARIGEAETAHNPDMLSDDQANSLIAVLSDEKRFLKPGHYAAADMAELESLCAVSGQIESAILRFDSKSTVDEKNDPQRKVLQLLILRHNNMEKFSATLAKLEPFQYRCVGKLSQPLMETLSAPGYELTKNHKTALDGMRSRSILTILNGIDFLSTSKSDAERITVAKALADNISDMVQPLPLSMRHMIDSASRVPSNTAPEDLKPYWVTILAALDDATCNIACQ